MTGQRVYKNRLLVNALDEGSRRSPEDVFLRYAGPTWETDGYESMTWRQLATAVDKAAHWLDKQLGEDLNAGPTVSYIGPNDARYFFITVGAIKTGRRILIPDGRIGGDGTLALLDEVNCNVWITTEDKRQNTEELSVQRPSLQIKIIPPLEYFLQEDATPPYPYYKTWEEAKEDIVFIIHTSGTTGNPKPIYHTNRFISTLDSWTWLSEKHSPKQISHDAAEGLCSLSACPPQWIAGLTIFFAAVFHQGRSMATLPADAHMPLDIQKVIKILEMVPEIKGLITPPRLIEDMFADEHGLRALKSFHYISVGGAPLDKKVGDALSKHINIFSTIGSTEGGAQMSFKSSDPAAWNSFDFVPETGARFERVSEDLFELWVDRTPDGELVQGILDVMDPDANTIALKEVYSPRRFADGSTRWVFRGRTDDLVKLSWLEKFDASDIEDEIKKHRLVEHVYVGGQARAVPFMIVQLHDQKKEQSSDEKAQVINDLFDHVISSRNAKNASEIRIPKEMVMLADPQKPFRFTLKGTVARKAMEDLYREDIEAMYRKWEEVNQ